MKTDGPSFRPLDGILVAIALTAAVVSGILVYGDSDGTTRLVIEAPSGSWIYDLETDRTVEVPGELGITVVRIEDGKARITASACPNKTCVAASPISRAGDWIACLPNKVMLRIDGEERESDEVDAIAK